MYDILSSSNNEQDFLRVFIFCVAKTKLFISIYAEQHFMRVNKTEVSSNFIKLSVLIVKIVIAKALLNSCLAKQHCYMYEVKPNNRSSYIC